MPTADFMLWKYNELDCRFWKPFNPILGETFEFINHDVGYALIAEQVRTAGYIASIVCSGGWGGGSSSDRDNQVGAKIKTQKNP